MSDTGLRLTYDLKDTLTANRFVGLWRMATGFRKIYLFAVVAAGLAALSRSAVFYLLRYFVDDVLTGAQTVSGKSRGWRPESSAWRCCKVCSPLAWAGWQRKLQKESRAGCATIFTITSRG